MDATVSKKVESACEVGILAVLILALAAFPPQRRVGNWTREDGLPLSSQERNRVDRAWFGYLPKFQPATHVVFRHWEKDGVQYGAPATGTCICTHYCWGVDWMWVGALVAILNGCVVFGYFGKRWFKDR